MKLTPESTDAVGPPGARHPLVSSSLHLYVCRGLPGVFQHVGGQPGLLSPAPPWLYLPACRACETGTGALKNAESLARLAISDDPEVVEAARLHRITVDNVLVAILANISNRPPKKDPVLNGWIAHTVTETLASQTRWSPAATSRSFPSLFLPDGGFDAFARRMLNALVDQHPDTVAALYRRTDGIYRQRFVVGNLHLYDKLLGELDAVTAASWLEAMSRKQFFLPADLLPNHPVFLDSPPSFLFVHPGPRSQAAGYIIAVCLTGDAGASVVSNVREIAHLAAMLPDSQYSASSELLALFMRLGDFIDTTGEVEDVLTEIFAVLHSHMILSRLVLLLPDGSSHSVTRQPGRIRVHRDATPVVASAGRRLCVDDEPVFIPDVAEADFSDDELKRYHVADVRSEALFPMTTEAGRSMVAVGSPVTGDYLASMTSLISGGVKFLCLWGELNRDPACRCRPAEGSGKVLDTARIQRRLRTMRKLTGGESIDILTLLSEIRGQTSAVQDALSSQAEGWRLAQLPAVMAHIAQAAEEACGQIGRLRDICALTEECFKGDVSVHSFLTELPSIVNAYAHQVSRSTNVMVAVVTGDSDGDDFSWPWSEVFDSVLSFLLSVIDSATQSGTITATARRADGTEAVRFEFSERMLGDADLDEVLVEAFGSEYHPSGGYLRQNAVQLGGTRVSFEHGLDGICCVTVSFLHLGRTSSGP